MVYGYGFSPWDRRVEFARNNFSRPIQTREIMVRNGDAHKPIWAAEYAWASLPDDWDGQPSIWGKSVSEETQAEYLVDGYLRAQREWPWMGLMAVWTFRFPWPPDDPSQVGNPTRGFAIVEHDFTPRPAYTALARAAARIQLANTGSYALTNQQQTDLRAGGVLRLGVSGDRLDIVVRGRGTLAVSFEERDEPISADGDWQRFSFDAAGEQRQITVADDMGGDPSDVVVVRVETTPGAPPPAVLGYVVARRPLHSWVYSWLNAALVGTLLLVLLSLLWAVRDLRVARQSAVLELAEPNVEADLAAPDEREEGAGAHDEPAALRSPVGTGR
jgi:hypothetical protein